MEGAADFQIFPTSPSPDDIAQGSLGDCYFVCSLSALAEFPERVRKLFVSQEQVPEGVFAVKINKNGLPYTVIIDNHFPCQDG